jgi:hypothetical protein
MYFTEGELCSSLLNLKVEQLYVRVDLFTLLVRTEDKSILLFAVYSDIKLWTINITLFRHLFHTTMETEGNY